MFTRSQYATAVKAAHDAAGRIPPQLDTLCRNVDRLEDEARAIRRLLDRDDAVPSHRLKARAAA